MQAGWKEKWVKGATGWHRGEVDRRLQENLKELTRDKPGVSILVTWCGKSVDLPWLCSQGFDVVGVELSELAVRSLFEENSIPYSVAAEGGFAIYQAQDRKLRVIAGDYYQLTPDLAGMFEAVWDNNAFGAAEPADRLKYISVLTSLLKPNGRILLAQFEYGEQVRHEAPFSLSCSLIKELFAKKYEVKFQENCDLFSKLFMEKFKVDWVRRNIHILTKLA